MPRSAGEITSPCDFFLVPALPPDFVDLPVGLPFGVTVETTDGDAEGAGAAE